MAKWPQVSRFSVKYLCELQNSYQMYFFARRISMRYMEIVGNELEKIISSDITIPGLSA